jgi:hypothetical protein
MEKASDLAKRGASLAKEHPKMFLALLFSFVLFILWCVNVFSLIGVKEENLDSETKKKVVNAKRSSYGIGVMAIIGVWMGWYNYKRS